MRPNVTERDSIDDLQGLADESRDLPIAISGLSPEIELNYGVRCGDGSWLVPGGALGKLRFCAVRDASTLSEPAPIVDLDALQRDLGRNPIEFQGLPPNVQFSTGVDLGGGRWRLNAIELKGLKLSLPPASPNEFRIVAKPAYSAERHEVELNMRLECEPAIEQSVRSVIVRDLPDGARLLGGTPLAENGAWAISRSDLGFLSVLPPRYRHGAFSLTVQAHYTDASGQPRQFEQRLPFCVASQPRAPRVEAYDTQGVAGQACPLRLFVDTPEPVAAHAVSIVVHGVPSVARLSRGVATGDGSWWLTPADLPGLTLLGPRAYASRVEMNIEALCVEIATGVRAATAPLPFILNVQASDHGTVVERERPAALVIDVDRVIVCAVPGSVELSHGHAIGDGCWSVPREDSANVALLAQGHSPSEAQPIMCTPLQHAHDPHCFTVDVAPLQRGAPLAATVLTMALDLTRILGSALGPRTLSVTVSGVPTGCELSLGTHQGNGVWLLPGASTPIVCLHAPTGHATEWRLQVDAMGGPGAADASATVCLRRTGIASASSDPEIPTVTETTSIFDAASSKATPAPTIPSRSVVHS